MGAVASASAPVGLSVAPATPSWRTGFSGTISAMATTPVHGATVVRKTTNLSRSDDLPSWSRPWRVRDRVVAARTPCITDWCASTSGNEIRHLSDGSAVIGRTQVQCARAGYCRRKALSLTTGMTDSVLRNDSLGLVCWRTWSRNPHSPCSDHQRPSELSCGGAGGVAKIAPGPRSVAHRMGSVRRACWQPRRRSRSSHSRAALPGTCCERRGSKEMRRSTTGGSRRPTTRLTCQGRCLGGVHVALRGCLHQFPPDRGADHDEQHDSTQGSSNPQKLVRPASARVGLA